MQTLISLSSLFLALAAAWVNAAPASDGRDGTSGSKQTIQSTEKSVMSDGRVYMLNALWFKEGGAAAYAEYGQAAGPIVEALGGRRLDGFVPTQSLIGDWQPDLLFIVEWPSWEAFFSGSRIVGRRLGLGIVQLE